MARLSFKCLVFALLSFYFPQPASYAQPSKGCDNPPVCNVCSDEITRKKLTCPVGHTTCAHCISGYVDSLTENPSAIQELRTEGLRCFHVTKVGAGTAETCKRKHPFEKISALVGKKRRKILSKISRAADAKPEAEVTKPPSDPSCEEDPQVTALRREIEDAFILSCPVCMINAQEHDACCAVECGNKACASIFCSLCFEYASESESVIYNHIRGRHTGKDSFETRFDEFDDLDEAGHKIKWSYEKRYHWLIFRRRLMLATHRVSPTVKQKVLNSIKKTLSGDYRLMMWPMPAGQTTLKWLKQLAADHAMPLKKKIWLLQNEAVFLRKEGLHADANLVDVKVAKLGGKRIVSFDQKREGTAFNSYVTALTPENPNPEMISLLEKLQRDHPGLFALGGETERIYRIADPWGTNTNPWNKNLEDPRWRGVAPFILSDLALDDDGNPKKMTHKEATQFCKNQGGSLATEYQLKGLSRAMSSNRVYNADDIAGMRDTLVWSSSVFFGRDNKSACAISGTYGGVGCEWSVDNRHEVRCVVSLDGHE